MTDVASSSVSGVWALSSASPLPTGPQLRGVVFVDDAIIIGDSGLRLYCSQPDGTNALDSAKEGRFSLLLPTEDGLIARTDELGQDTLYYYHREEYWAIGNSFMAVCEKAKADGRKLTLCALVAVTMNGSSSLTEQLLNHATPVEQIRVVPLGHHVRLKLAPARLAILRDEKKSRSVMNEDDYAEALLHFASDWIARIRALLAAFPGSIQADISGGLDSRVVLGLLVASGVDLRGIDFRSNAAAREDFEVANTLASRFGFQLNRCRAPAPSITASAALSLWQFGNVGIYTPMTIPQHGTPLPLFHFHGAGGESLRRFFNSPVDGFLRSLRRQHAKTGDGAAASSALLAGLAEIDVDPASPSAMDHHYRCYRSRFHFGRDWFRRLAAPVVTPLMSPALIRAAYSLPDERRAQSQVLYDLMILLAPALVEMRFDLPSKTPTSEHLESSPFSGKRRPTLPQPRALNVYGLNTPWKPSMPKNEERLSDQRFRELLSTEMGRLRTAALATGILEPEYFTEANRSLRSPVRTVKAGRDAGRAIGLGYIAGICGQGESAPRVELDAVAHCDSSDSSGGR